MFDRLKSFISELAGEPNARPFSQDDYRLAAAALFIHLAGADGAIDAPERKRLRAIIEKNFGLDAEATTRLLRSAEASDREAVDFYHFTHILTRALDQDGRQKIVEMMWEIAFADGTVQEVEENIVARVAELLGVSPHDRVRLRREVEAKITEGTAFAGPWTDLAVPAKE